jgi:homoserine dehydrogenase
MTKEIKVGILGLGTVGSKVAKELIEKSNYHSTKSGYDLNINVKKILVRNKNKEREFTVSRELLTEKIDDILHDPEISVIIEVMGGEEPARTYIEESLKAGKNVVTANKEVIAKHGKTLKGFAINANKQLLFEASVGGGIPIIHPISNDLSANNITRIRAIINGTTNYILTKMSQENMNFNEALNEAKSLGYAEADPTNDIEGIDAAYKIAILASIAFQVDLRPEDIYVEGITKLTSKDFKYAKELGYEIKLLAIARKDFSENLQVRVHPTLVEKESGLANINGAYNAIEFEGDLVGYVTFSGPGAGSSPTTSAILSDLLSIAQENFPTVPRQKGTILKPAKLTPMASIACRYYLLLNTLDQPGVLAKIGTIFKKNGISISAVIQKDTHVNKGTAELVITTHMAKENSIQMTLNDFEGIDLIDSVESIIRIEDN